MTTEEKALAWVTLEETEVIKRLRGASFCCTCPSAYKAYLAGHAEAQRWIPVSEQPCPIGVRVLMWFVTIGEPKGPDGVTIGQASAHEIGQFWDDFGMYRSLDRLTHWMPLPQLPATEPSDAK